MIKNHYDELGDNTKRRSRRKTAASDSDDDDEEEYQGYNEGSKGQGARRRTRANAGGRRSRKRGGASKSRRSGPGGKRWTKAEDQRILSLHATFDGIDDIFTQIAQDDLLLANERTAAQLETRYKQLLDQELKKAAKKKTRRRRRRATSDSSESDSEASLEDGYVRFSWHWHWQLHACIVFHVVTLDNVSCHVAM